MRRFVIALLIAAPVSAQPSGPADEPISISRLVDIAVDKSTTLQRARNAKHGADLGEVIAGAPAEWQIEAQTNVNRVHQEQQQVGVDDTKLSASVGLAKQLGTGGDVSVTMSGTEHTQDLSGVAARDATSGHDAQGSVQLSMRQPLLRGRGMGASVDVHKAELVADAAGFQLAELEGSTLRDLVAQYWELAYARANVAVRRSSLELANDQLALTQHMLERGTVPESAIKAARYGVALRQEALLRAIDDVSSASLALRKNAGLEIGPDLGDLAPTDALVTEDRRWDAEATLSIALAHNPRIAAASRGIAIATVEVERTANAVYPALDVTVGGGLFGSGPDDGAAWNAMTNGSYSLTGGLAFKWEAGGAAAAAAKSARIDRGSARLVAKDAERDVVTAVIDGVRHIRAAQQRAGVAHAAVELADANLATEQALFRAGKSNNVLVFQRENELEEARLLEARAAADYQIALVTLEYLTGHLLARYRVEISPRARP